MSSENNSNTARLALRALLADDRQVVLYRPRWNTFTGGVSRTLFLQQVIFRWMQAGGRPFYKFSAPCKNRLYRHGDSWQEELAMNRREFENARSGLASRTRGNIDPTTLVSFWVDANRLTWYALNEDLLFERLAALHPTSGAGVQIALPDELMDETYISDNGRNVQKPPAELLDETYISATAPNVQLQMDETSNSGNARNVHPLYSENEITQENQSKTTTASPTTPPPAAVAAADPLAPILTWFGFEDALTPKERTALDVATLLAWAYWVLLTQAEQGSRVRNPVGLVRAQWRKGTAPRADLLRLARNWVLLDDGRRARLLGRLEWSVAYGQYDPGEPLDDEFPDIPIAAAAAVFAATAGELGPPSLMPPREAIPPRPAPRNEAQQPQPLPLPSTDLWRDALAELEMQMSKSTFTKWLQGTTAAETDDGLTIHVHNEFAAEWLSKRLHPVIERTVAGLARRPLSIHYEVRDVT